MAYQAGGAECLPETSDWEICGDLPGKRGEEKRVNGGKGRNILKGKVENFNVRRKSYKMRRGPFVLFCF